MTLPSLQTFAPGVNEFALAMDIFNVTTARIAKALGLGFEYMNSPLQMPTPNLRQSNLTNIVYQCNMPWLFDQLWLAGTVQLAASNVWHTFVNRASPQAWTISRSGYLALFIIVDMAAVAGAVIILLVLKKRGILWPKIRKLADL